MNFFYIRSKNRISHLIFVAAIVLSIISLTISQSQGGWVVYHNYKYLNNSAIVEADINEQHDSIEMYYRNGDVDNLGLKAEIVDCLGVGWGSAYIKLNGYNSNLWSLSSKTYVIYSYWKLTGNLEGALEPLHSFGSALTFEYELWKKVSGADTLITSWDYTYNDEDNVNYNNKLVCHGGGTHFLSAGEYYLKATVTLAASIFIGCSGSHIIDFMDFGKQINFEYLDFMYWVYIPGGGGPYSY